jgi:hypothetical protein
MFFSLKMCIFVSSNYFPYLCGVIVYSLVLIRKFSILSVVIAASLMVAFIVVPHHHHGAMMCLVTQHHEDAHGHQADHACTPHHCDGEEAPNAGSHCVAELEYLASNQQEINCHHFSCTLHHPPFHLLPALFVPVNLSDDLATTPGRKHKYRPVIAIVESAGAGQNHGLRAPPIS